MLLFDCGSGVSDLTWTLMLFGAPSCQVSVMGMTAESFAVEKDDVRQMTSPVEPVSGAVHVQFAGGSMGSRSFARARGTVTTTLAAGPGPLFRTRTRSNTSSSRDGDRGLAATSMRRSARSGGRAASGDVASSSTVSSVPHAGVAKADAETIKPSAHERIVRLTGRLATVGTARF